MSEYTAFFEPIIDDDHFVTLPLSAQALYFHLAIDADRWNDVCYRPKAIARMIGATEEDIEILKEHSFIQNVDGVDGIMGAVKIVTGGVKNV